MNTQERQHRDNDFSEQAASSSNPHTIQNYLQCLGNPITEVRLFPKNHYLNIPTRKFVGKTVSGYYDADHYHQIWEDIQPFDGKADIYCTIHSIDESLAARYNNRLEMSAETTTSDLNVKSFTVFPIDVDPDRPSGISSTNDELEHARKAIEFFADLFKDLGLPEPIKALSGNGYHTLLLLEPFSVTKENEERFKALGDMLPLLFQDTDTPCKLDGTIYNPARILKLYGTIACKGDNTEDRPHRQSKVWLPETVERVSFDDLEKAILGKVPKRDTATSVPKDTPPKQPLNASKGENEALEPYLKRHNVEWTHDKDTQNGTVYYLTCPFDANHNGTDAFVIERTDGKKGFTCRHNSCRGKDWQAFKAKLGLPDLKPTTANESATSTAQQPDPSSDGRFAINITDMPMHEIADQVHSHWRTLDDDSIFVRGDSLCRVLSHRGKTEAFNDDTFHLWLSRRFSFWKLDKRSGKLVPLGLIPERIIRPLLRDLPDFAPRINAVYQHPVILPGGAIAKESRYIPEIQAYLISNWTGWDDLDISDAGVEAAKALLLDDLLHDFIWEDESKANFLAYLLTFAMRPAIIGNVPMLAVTAPVQGAGKTLLLDLAHIIWQGEQALATQVGSDDRSEREEMRKRLTALLMESPESVVFDNATRAFNDPALASVLTTGRYQDRVLGASVNVELNVRTIFAATGNHLRFEGDMPRRVYWCRLGVDREKPETRGEFKHPRLNEWATENRNRLMKACLTLIKAWCEKDMPLDKDIAFGSYEAWAQTMGGILHSCGIKGFSVSENTTDSEELIAMRDFCEAVYEKRKSEPWTTANVFNIASHDDDDGKDDDGMLDSWLGSGKNQSRKTRLGLFLSERSGRYFGDFRLFKSDEKLRGASLFVVHHEAARDDTDRSNASSNASSREHPANTQVQGEAARDDTHPGGTRGKVSDFSDRLTNIEKGLPMGIIPSSDGSGSHDNRAEGAARVAASVGSIGIIPSSESAKTPENCSENEQLESPSVSLVSAPAHEPHAASGSFLDSLTPPQKFFLESLPIRDDTILTRFHDEGGFALIDLVKIKEIKKFLIGAELIEFDENLKEWTATEKYLKLTTGRVKMETS